MISECPAIPGGQFVDISDARLFYQEHGAGDPLLLLHGGLESSAIWAGVVPLLATRFRVIASDSRGHGRSTNPGGHLSYRQLADDTVAFIAALGLQCPAIVGWSDGGQVTLEIGLRYPDVARTLITGGAVINFGQEFQRSVRDLFGIDATGTVDIRHVEAALGEKLSHFRSLHASTEGQWHVFLAQTAHMWLEYPGLSETDFSHIAAPTLVIAGDRDEFVPVEVAAAMYRMLPSAALAICPSANHGLPETHSAWFAQTILDFLGHQNTAAT